MITFDLASPPCEPYSARAWRIDPVLAQVLAPRPIIELIDRFALTDGQRRRVFADHDAGDEDASTRRRYAKLVCGLSTGRECRLEPNHFGPHEWQRREIDPNTLLVLKPFNRFTIVTAEQLAEAARAEHRFSPHDGEG